MQTKPPNPRSVRSHLSAGVSPPPPLCFRIVQRVSVCCFAVCLAAFPAKSFAQAWVLDPAVAPVVTNEPVVNSRTQFVGAPGGMFLAYGSFTSADGRAATGVARLRADTTLDTSFTSDLLKNETLQHIAPLPDGRAIALLAIDLGQNTPAESVVASGNGGATENLTVIATRTPALRLVRLRTDGRKDSSFTPLMVEGASVILLPLLNGRLLVRGSFSTIGGTPRNGLARLNSDGTLDPSFAPNLTSIALAVNAVAEAPDGSLLISAAAFATNGRTAYFFNRLLATGEIDPRFAPGTVGTTYTLLAVQADGRVLAGNGTLTRYSATGVVDRTYAVQIPQLSYINRIAPLPAGRLAIEASMRTPSGLGTAGVFILNAEGQVERDFRKIPGASEGQNLVAASVDGRVVVLQGPLVVNGSFPLDVLSAAPTDTTSATTQVGTVMSPIFLGPIIYNPALAISNADVTSAAPLAATFTERQTSSVSGIEIDATGRALISGSFTHVNGQPRPGLARILANGALDASFAPIEGQLLFAPPDGRPILSRTVLGPVNSSDGFHRTITQVVRLQANGTVDPGFAVPDFPTNTATKWLAAAPDGRLLISIFEPDDANDSNLKLIWLGADGRRLATLPTTFGGLYRIYPIPLATATTNTTAVSAGTAVDVPAPTLAIFPYYNYNRPNPIDSVRIVAGDRLLISGGFLRIDGLSRPDLARLNADGSVDRTYAPPVATDSNPTSVAAGSATTTVAVTSILPFGSNASALPLADGRAIVIRSTFSAGRLKTNITRLRTEGTADPTFTPSTSLPNYLVPLADGSFFSGGLRFSSEGVQDRNFAPVLRWSGQQAYSSIAAIDAGGSLWLGGVFDAVNGEPRTALARFKSTEIRGITFGPVSQTVIAGKSATFDVVIGTSLAATYRWTRNGIVIPGATGSSLVISTVTTADGGAYRAAVTIAGQTTASDSATLTVTPNSSRLINFSARSRVDPSTPPQVAGFGSGGAVSRTVLLRATGRGLPGSNSATMLPVPVLTLYSGSRVVAEDRGGATAQPITTLAREVGAFPIAVTPSAPGTIYGSALSTLIGGGATFTASTTSGDGGAGVSLFELYDTGSTSAPPLIRNLAIRGQTAPGANVLIAGFVIAGNGPLRVLIRGIGPSLANFGLAGAVADPVLTLFSSDTSVPIAINDNWENDPSIAAASAGVGAFALPAASRDAALLVTLEPGAYTAQLAGVNNTSGTGLIEIYAAEPE